MSELAGKIVLVIGANGSLGSAVARQAAARGATVVLSGRRVAPLERLYDEIEGAGGPQPALYPLNLEGMSPNDAQALGERLQVEFGHLDGVVVAATRLHGLTPLERFEPEEWLRTLQVDLNAPFLLATALLPALRAAPAGRLVYALDQAARSSSAFFGAYGVAQAALRSMLTILAQELSAERVRVHGVVLPAMRGGLRQHIYASDPATDLPTAADLAPAILAALSSAADAPTLIDAS